MQDKIVIRGAREHNLKNISLELPRNKMIVFTGLSGSGKSSLAFDTIFAEGQRRYVESLSSYARQFLGQMDKPDVDEIWGFRQRFRLIKRHIRLTRVQRSPPLRRFMTIFVFCTLGWANRTARCVASRFGR